MRYFIFVLILNLTSAAHAQINASVSWNYTGNSLRLGYAYMNKRISLEAGIKCHFKNLNSLDSRRFTYRGRFHPFKDIQGIGLFHNSKYFIANGTQKSYKFYVMNDIMFNYMGMKHKVFECTDTLAPYDIRVFREQKFERSPFLSIEGNLGAGFVTHVSPLFKLYFEVGTGIIYFHESLDLFVDPDSKHLIGIIGPPEFDLLTGHFRVGFSYLLKKNATE
jgi:hypothetical protein